MNFSVPGGSGSVSGASPGGSSSPLGAQEGPGGLRKPKARTSAGQVYALALADLSELSFGFALVFDLFSFASALISLCFSFSFAFASALLSPLL